MSPRLKRRNFVPSIVAQQPLEEVAGPVLDTPIPAPTHLLFLWMPRTA